MGRAMAADLARRAALAMRRELMMDGVVGEMQLLVGVEPTEEFCADGISRRGRGNG
jgi:hypothetical protein